MPKPPRCSTSRPSCPDSEYLDRAVLDDLWSRLNATYQRQIKSYNGSVADFVATLSPKVHLVGRVFFHLVESKKDEYPFAFLATYSTGLDQKSGCKHVPLKHALAEYGADSRKLLDLLTTVHQAAAESQFLFRIPGQRRDLPSAGPLGRRGVHGPEGDPDL